MKKHKNENVNIKFVFSFQSELFVLVDHVSVGVIDVAKVCSIVIFFIFLKISVII